MNRLPNFLIIGAAKCGTTSLFNYLDQHPEVFFPESKEPNYFALAGKTLPRPGPAPTEVLSEIIHPDSVTDFDLYSSLFDTVRDEKAVGEASVRYLYFPEAPGRIKERIPDVRMIAVLREPVSRLYSHYCMNAQFQLEPLSIEEAIEREDTRRKANWGWDWHYVNVSLYSEQVKRYYDIFDRDQVKVILYDDFRDRPLEVYQEVCRHIGVSDRFNPDMSKRSKVTYRPRNPKLERWLHWPNATRKSLEQSAPRLMQRLVWELERWNSAPVPKLDPALREELQDLFRDDVEKLQDLLQRTIPWYSPAKAISTVAS